MGLREDAWRKLRLECVWRYRKWDLVPPPQLQAYIRQLPEDAMVWSAYCSGITHERQKHVVARRREAESNKEIRLRQYKREYMRDYMRKRRGSKRSNVQP